MERKEIIQRATAFRASIASGRITREKVCVVIDQWVIANMCTDLERRLILQLMDVEGDLENNS